MNNQKSCIIFFMKYPWGNDVKTRLAKDIGIRFAQELYRRFILDMLNTLKNSQKDIVISVSNAERIADVEKWLGSEYAFAAQQEANLGERMSNAFRKAFDSGYENAIIIGSDLPDLPLYFVESAFLELAGNDIVIGPAADGGYYLIGFKHDTFNPGILGGIDWSTDRVFRQTVTKTEKLGLTMHLLPQWRDVDDIDGLKAFFARNRDAKYAGVRSAVL